MRLSYRPIQPLFHDPDSTPIDRRRCGRFGKRGGDVDRTIGEAQPEGYAALGAAMSVEDGVPRREWPYRAESSTRWFPRRIHLLLILAAAACGAEAAAMTFTRLAAGPCAKRSCVVAAGPIDYQSLTQFRTFAAQNRLPEGTIVFLQSDGGDHQAGIDLGRETRKRGFYTFVAGHRPGPAGFGPAECASACAYFFLGGVQRGVGRSSRLGVHQVLASGVVSPRSGMEQVQQAMGNAAEHVRAMGASTDLLAPTLKTPPESLYWLNRAELIGYNAITLDLDLVRDPKRGPYDFWTMTE